MFHRVKQRAEKAGREGKVALGLTNDLDTAVWISFTSIAASKCTSLSSRIHTATVELERIQKQPTGRLFDRNLVSHSVIHSLSHLRVGEEIDLHNPGDLFKGELFCKRQDKLDVCYSAPGRNISLHVMQRLQVLTTANRTID